MIKSTQEDMNKVNIQKSLSLNSPSTQCSKLTLSSKDKYFGSLFDNFGVSNSTVGFLSKTFSLKAK